MSSNLINLQYAMYDIICIVMGISEYDFMVAMIWIGLIYLIIIDDC